MIETIKHVVDVRSNPIATDAALCELARCPTKQLDEGITTPGGH